MYVVGDWVEGNVGNLSFGDGAVVDINACLEQLWDQQEEDLATDITNHGLADQ